MVENNNNSSCIVIVVAEISVTVVVININGMRIIRVVLGFRLGSITKIHLGTKTSKNAIILQ